MQGNDLGSHWSQKFVVICEPTLFIPPPDAYRFTLGRRQYGRKDAVAAEFEINRGMVQFMVNMGRYRNIPTEIWTFIDNEDIVEALATKLDKFAGDCVVGWSTWDEELDAVLELNVDASIHTVYDADPDRVERCWGMRGQRVLKGQPPSS